MQNFEIGARLTRKVWRQLADGEVPVARRFDLLRVDRWVQEVNRQLKQHSYLPSVVHGYLGIEKNFGVTRFIPIISKEDMAVYYHLCGEIGDLVIRDVPNIYGGWRAIPTAPNVSALSRIRRQGNLARLFQQNYYSSPFSNAAWFQQFRSYNELIGQLVADHSTLNYVVKTDIANFYDSIDVGRLLRKLRRDASGLDEHISLLEVFLGYWNRRTSGYQQSSRGIPQDIISDGSRNLSHYYLQDFDEKFIKHCSERGLVYVRWADDILIFGSSSKALESAVHAASRLLLADGLNLNASKTKLFTRRDFEAYRGIKVLRAIENRDLPEFRSQIRIMERRMRRESVKLDTVFRAAIGYTASLGSSASSFERDFLERTTATNPSFLGGLNTKQLYRLIATSGNPIAAFGDIMRTVTSKEVTAPKANFLALIRDSARQLAGLGIDAATLSSAIDEVRSSSGDSEILIQFCVGAAVDAVSELP